MADNYFGITDKGRQRGNNEDAFIAQPVEGKTAIIGCVIDGVGGYEGGEVAAAIARDTIIKTLNSSINDLPSDLSKAFQAANDLIYKEKLKVKQHQNMACVATLAIADINNNQFHYAHVGDTRLYLFRDRSLVKISSDHSFVGFLEDSGRLTEDAAMNHPKRNEINKALGFETQIVSEQGYIETGSSPFLSGDLLLLCSDGLTDMVTSQEITTILSGDDTLSAKGKKLIDIANKNGGKDNITAVLVQSDKAGARQPAVMPAQDQKKKWQTFPKTSPAKTGDAQPASSISTARRGGGNRGWLIFLVLICIASLLYNGYQYAEHQSSNSPFKPIDTIPTVSKKPKRGAIEARLQDTITKFAKKDTLIISDQVFKSPVVITDTIHIDRDTLYIKGRGNVVLKADSAYSGAAIAAGPKCKYIVLENLTIDGFTNGLFFANNSVYLKHVKLVNCKTAVQTTLAVPANQFVSGHLSGQVFKQDSLPKKIKK